MITIDNTRLAFIAVAIIAYTALVSLATYAIVSISTGSSGSVVDDLNDAHQEELSRLHDIHEKELAERDLLLDEYQQDMATARSDYWATVSQIEGQIRAQRSDILKRIYEDPDAAAKLLADQYGLIYVP